MANLVIKKTTLYLIGIVILVILGIYFVSSNNVGGTNANKANTVGAVQKITIGFKNGNYYPNAVTVEPNRPVRIYLDSSVKGCYRTFVIRSFGVSKSLPTSSDYVEFTPTKEGTFGFACGMGMGTGTLIVGNANANSATAAADTQKVAGSCGGSGGSCGGGSGGGCGCGGSK